MAEADAGLLERFDREILSKVPHEEGGRIAGATPLVDMTADLAECAREAYGAEMPAGLRVYGKVDSGILSGSVKVRPAVRIIRDAIASGRLRGGQAVIEATSGNFGIALGKLAGLGVTVIALVSRRLQEGVFGELRGCGVRVIDLDMDICPAPGAEGSADALAAKAAAANIRSQLAGMGLGTAEFDARLPEIEKLLEAQDIIRLAKLLAGAYGMFCPEQYDSELNLEAHSAVTAPEIDAQLREAGASLADYEVVCTFGTGGTSGGIGRYVSERYGRKAVHVVFPPAGQDVAGIRTRAKAEGLKYYRPGDYAGVHEADFGKARELMRLMVKRGHDIGESSALELYAIAQMAAAGRAERFVAIVADGAAKYKKSLEAGARQAGRVSLQEAASSAGSYDRVLWVHAQYAPREEGIEMLARSLGVDRSKIYVSKASEVGSMLQTGRVPEELGREACGRSLLVCMAGNTSLRAAGVLAGAGMEADSLDGGITGLPEGQGRSPGEYVRAAEG